MARLSRLLGILILALHQDGTDGFGMQDSTFANFIDVISEVIKDNTKMHN